MIMDAYLKTRLTWSVAVTILIILAFMDDANRMRGRTNSNSVLVEGHGHGMKHLYRFLKKTRIIPIPIIIPVHHSHQ